MAATQAQVQALITNYDIRLIADNSNASSNPSRYFAMKPKNPSSSSNSSILAPFMNDPDYSFATLWLPVIDVPGVDPVAARPRRWGIAPPRVLPMGGARRVIRGVVSKSRCPLL
jgi:hypothetical protein